MSEQDPNQQQSEQASGADSQAPSDAAAAEQPGATGPTATETEAVSTSLAPTADAGAGAPEGGPTGAEAPAANANSESADAATAEGSKAKSDLGSKAGKSGTSRGSTTGGGPGSAVSKAMSGTGGSKAAGSSSRIKSSTSRSGTGGSTTGAGITASSARSHHSTTRAPSSTSRAGPSAGSTRKRVKLGELDLATARIGFLGAGKIAESTINGLIHYGKISPSRIYVSAPSSKGLERFKTLGCKVTKRNYDIFGRYDCDIVFLAFHGYVIKHCYKLGGPNRPHPLCTNYIPHQRHPVYILSLVSGVSLGQIRQVLLNPDNPARYVVELHRIMFNTAVGHGLGLCAIDCEPDSKKLSPPIRQLLSSIAQLEHVPATQMDAACAIGGSGLAFSYYFINALADGAFRMGLSRAQAIRFASKTAQCAAQTMLESGKHPAELRDNVSAPSGAAIYGIHVLEKNDVASGVTAAVEAAHKRAHDLATQDMTTQ